MDVPSLKKNAFDIFIFYKKRTKTYIILIMNIMEVQKYKK